MQKIIVIFIAIIAQISILTGTTAYAEEGSTYALEPMLSESNFSENVNDGLVLWYDFSDVSSNIVKDISDHGNDGMIPEGAGVVQKVGNAISLDGVSQYVQLPDGITDGIGDFTISLWMKNISRATAIHNKPLFDFGGKLGYLPQSNSSGGYRQGFNIGGMVYGTGNTAGTGEAETSAWNHLTITQQDGKTTLYINGVENVSQKTIKLSQLGTLINNYIGTNSNKNSFFNTEIDEFKLYNRALSSAEVIENGFDAFASDKEKLDYAVNAINIDTSEAYRKDIALPIINHDEFSISWTSSDESIITNDGKITRPESGISSAIITANITVGGESTSKSFEIDVDNVYSTDYTLNITAEKGVDISDGMIGLFFEDINYAADGGLYAEMIENRSFEAMKSSAWNKKEPEPDYKWSLYPAEGDGAVMKYESEGGIHENNPTYLVFTGVDGQLGFSNHGYDGLNIKSGMAYNVSFWAKTDEYSGDVKLSFVKDGEVNGETMITEEITDEWKKYEGTIIAEEDARYSDFAVELTEPGTVKFDMLSCIPDDAVYGVFRRDLADMIKDINPGFLRFPGGCIVEGYDLDNRYQWKLSVGGVETRKQNWTRWATHASYVTPYYNQSLGIGFYEYFLLCEYIGAKPVPVVNVGLACQYNTHEAVDIDSEEFQQYIQDSLDLIEFANSTDFENSEWARLRRDMGHPEPFNMEFLGIGNEQWEEEYNGVNNKFKERYARFESAIHEKYPEIKLINTASAFMKDTSNEAIWEDAWNWIYNETNQNSNFQYAVDEHYYMTPDWFYENVDLYDTYNRSVNVFAGEYAARLQADSKANNPDANTLNTALAEAAFMTGFEKNADIVKMASAAPLFARLNYTQWSPDLIWFDDDKAYGSPNYYVQKMYGNNMGDYTLNSTFEEENEEIYQSVSYDEDTDDVIIKLINRSDEAREIKINIDPSYKVKETAKLTSMSGDYSLAVNSIDNPENIIPIDSVLSGISNEYVYNMPGYAFSIIRINVESITNTESRKTPVILSGEIFGYTQAQDALPEYAFDNDITTFYDAAPANGYTGIKLDSPKNISKIEFYPRTSHSSHPARIQNGIFEASNDGENWEVLYTVPSDANILIDYNVVEELNNKLKTYKYLRYRNPVNWNSIAEIRFYTEEFTAPYVAQNIECVSEVPIESNSLEMPYVPEGFTISVYSSDSDVINTDGAVTHKNENQYVNLRFAVTNESTGAVSITDEFTIEVEADLDEKGKVEADLEAITIEDSENLNHSLFLPISGEYDSEITWESNSEAVTLTKESDKWTCVITRPESGTTKAVLTAIAVNGDAMLTKEFPITIASKAQETGYLFVSHAKDDEAVYFSLSRDGYKFNRINNNEAIIRNTAASLGVRDPFILKGEDGYFYIIGTEMKAANGWKNKNFVTWKSADLITWTDQTIIPVVDQYDLTTGADVAWAPEAIYDNEKGMYMIYWSNGKLDGQYMCGIYTRDFKTLEGEPFVLYKDQSGNNKPVIDGNIIKSEDKYYMFVKDENTGGLCRVESDTLSGEYGNLIPILQNGELGEGREAAVEGPSIYQLIDEPSKYVMVYDHFQVSNYGLAETTDFENFSVLTGNESVQINSEHQASHGNVIRLEEADFQRLNKAYGKYEFAARHILGGKYADPDIQAFGNKFYIFPTSDGYANWGGTYFKAFSSTDMVHWTDEGIILDLKDVAWANENAWAPCMVEKNGKYYFYYTAEKKIGVAVSDSPTGPFADLGEPLVTDEDIIGIGRGQIIDPYVLIDYDGRAYLYFGNQNMFVVELGEDMTSLKGEIKNITPSENPTGFIADQYMEGTCVTKINGKYYFSWSCNGTTDENYHVKYGVADSPMGTIKRVSDGKENSGDLLLEKDDSQGILGAGHHSIVKVPGKDEYYIAYHRFYMPGGNGYNREVCVDKLIVNEDGSLEQVIPTTAGILNKVTYNGLDRVFVTPTVYEDNRIELKIENLNDTSLNGTIYVAQYKDGVLVDLYSTEAVVNRGGVNYIGLDIAIEPQNEVKVYLWNDLQQPMMEVLSF